MLYHITAALHFTTFYCTQTLIFVKFKCQHLVVKLRTNSSDQEHLIMENCEAKGRCGDNIEVEYRQREWEVG